MSWLGILETGGAMLFGALAPPATAAAVLAACVFAATRVVRHPAVAHLLWLAVVVRLLVPTAVALPVLPEAWAPAVFTLATPSASPAGGKGDVGSPPWIGDHREVAVPASTAGGSAKTRDVGRARPYAALTTLVWLAGVTVLLALAAVRGRRARVTRRAAGPPPAELVRRVGQLSARVGLARPPAIAVVDDATAPHLALDRLRAMLVLPKPLLARLGERELDAVLVHELAHLRRGDPWTRPLEALAVAVYWWHPVVWWARRHLRRAEERACDVWVARTLPGTGRAYAEGLLSALELILGRHPHLPTTATAITARDDLEERLIMIVNDRTPKPLSTRGRLAATALALVAVMAGPTWRSRGDEATAPTADEAAARTLAAQEAALEARMAELESELEALAGERESLAREAMQRRIEAEAAALEAAGRHEEAELARDEARIHADESAALAEMRQAEHALRAKQRELETRARDHARALRDMAEAQAMAEHEAAERQAHEALDRARAEMARATERLDDLPDGPAATARDAEARRLMREVMAAQAAVEAEGRALEALNQALLDSGMDAERARAIVENHERRRVDGGLERAQEALERAEHLLETASEETRPTLEALRDQLRALTEDPR